MKDKFLAFLVSKAGGILTPIIAVGVGMAVAKLAKLDPKLADSVDQTSITAFIVTFIISLVNYATNSVQVKGVKQIQALVNTDVDGVAGPVTYTEVRRAIEVPVAKKARKPACSRKKRR